jgi:hypothetical protein
MRNVAQGHLLPQLPTRQEGIRLRRRELDLPLVHVRQVPAAVPADYRGQPYGLSAPRTGLERTIAGMRGCMRIVDGLVNDLLDSNGILSGMPVAVHGVRAASGLQKDVGPHDSGLDVHAGHPAQVDGHFVLGEPGPLPPGHSRFGNFEDRRENVIPAGPPARDKNFCIHAQSLFDPNTGTAQRRGAQNLCPCAKRGKPARLPLHGSPAT